MSSMFKTNVYTSNILPSWILGTILLLGKPLASLVFGFTEPRAIIGLPLPSKPSAAPLIKSTWPPYPNTDFNL